MYIILILQACEVVTIVLVVHMNMYKKVVEL